jgi:hypothetical protein
MDKLNRNVHLALRSHGEEPGQKTYLGCEGCTVTRKQWHDACKKYKDYIQRYPTVEENKEIEVNLETITESVFKLIDLVHEVRDRKASTRSGSSKKQDSTLGRSYETTSAAGSASNYTQ